MTLEERLCLARAGYSAQDIAGFEKSENFVQDPKPAQEQDPKPAQEQDPKPAQEQDPKPVQEQDPKSKQEAEKMPAWAVALEQSIKTLTAAAQVRNVKFDDMGDSQSVDDAAQAALNAVYGGKTK